MSPAPIGGNGKPTAPSKLNPSGGSGKNENGTYDWLYTDAVISFNGGTEPTTPPSTEPTPSTPSTEPTPSTPSTEPTPSTPSTEPTPSTPSTEPAPSTPGTEPTPSTPGTAQNCTVTFKANGGTQPSKASISVASGKEIGTLPTVGRKNYTFKGWYTKKSGGTKVTASTKITKNQTVYAQWTKVSVKQVSAPTVKKAASGKMSVKIKKVSGAKGYQITYSTSSKFKDSKNAATTSLNKTIGKLKKGKTYYVKVRAYKFDSQKNKVYGKYSKTVKVKL